MERKERIKQNTAGCRSEGKSNTDKRKDKERTINKKETGSE